LFASGNQSYAFPDALGVGTYRPQVWCQVSVIIHHRRSIVLINCLLTRFVLVGDIPLRLELELVLLRGLAHFDLRHFLRKVLLPLLLPLLDLLTPSYLLPRILPSTVPYATRAIVARYAVHSCLAVYAALCSLRQLVSYVIALHTEIRDSRYLLVTQLTNRGHKQLE
jgi:hypothetical protein